MNDDDNESEYNIKFTKEQINSYREWYMTWKRVKKLRFCREHPELCVRNKKGELVEII